MNSTQRNLWIGLAGIVALLVCILVYAQVNASHNFDLGTPSQAESVSL